MIFSCDLSDGGVKLNRNARSSLVSESLRNRVHQENAHFLPYLWIFATALFSASNLSNARRDALPHEGWEGGGGDVDANAGMFEVKYEKTDLVGVRKKFHSLYVCVCCTKYKSLTLYS